MQLRRCRTCAGPTLERYGMFIDPGCSYAAAYGKALSLRAPAVQALYRLAVGTVLPSSQRHEPGAGVVSEREIADWLSVGERRVKSTTVRVYMEDIRRELRRVSAPVHIARAPKMGFELCEGPKVRITSAARRHMRKAFIRQVVDLALSYNGYPPSYYGWIKPGYLEVWDGKDKRVILHMPAVHKFKLEHLKAELSKLECIGEPRESPVRPALDKEEQLDLVEVLEALKSPRPDPTHLADATAYALSADAPQVAWYREGVSLEEMLDHLSPKPATSIDEMLARADRPRVKTGMHAQ